ncbi:MAG: PfkB family carbohydrate kinase [Pseudomonas sp.]|uniref:PfkB family carbohydrate kinase n=1 Tax=Pseudomonas sp. TaxID=306 RepID=UPI003D11D0C3
MPRLLHSGQVIVDLVMPVECLPIPGGEVLAESAHFDAGGGFNVMAAAARNGLSVVYLGRHGQGRFGDLAREAMQAEGIQMSLPCSPGADTGLCVVLTDASGERTFISHIGAEGELSAQDLAQVRVTAEDFVYVSGYSLLQASKARALLDWLLDLPAMLPLMFDPGPLLASVEPALLATLLPRVDIWSSNRVEALQFTGCEHIAAALEQLAVRLAPDALVVLRDGPRGCWVGQQGRQVLVPGFAVEVLDSNGAGDAHAGVFIAALAAGLDPLAAARRANAAAALAVTRRGPATAPGSGEVDALLEVG